MAAQIDAVLTIILERVIDRRLYLS
jgi:hypothetical protein